jgi:hypothetical protein
MQFQRIGVFIATDGGPVDPPANPPEPLRKVVVPVGSNTAVPFDFDEPVEGAWFTPVDGLANIARFNQIFTRKPSGNHVDLIVSARDHGASLIGFINALI